MCIYRPRAAAEPHGQLDLAGATTMYNIYIYIYIYTNYI